MLTKAQFIWYKYSKQKKKQTTYFNKVIYSYDGKADFSITPDFSVT